MQRPLLHSGGLSWVLTTWSPGGKLSPLQTGEGSTLHPPYSFHSASTRLQGSAGKTGWLSGSQSPTWGETFLGAQSEGSQRCEPSFQRSQALCASGGPARPSSIIQQTTALKGKVVIPGGVMGPPLLPGPSWARGAGRGQRLRSSSLSTLGWGSRPCLQPGTGRPWSLPRACARTASGCPPHDPAQD